MFKAAMILLITLVLLSFYIPQSNSQTLRPKPCLDNLHVFGRVTVNDPSRLTAELRELAQDRASQKLAELCRKFGGEFTFESVTSWTALEDPASVSAEAKGFCKVNVAEGICENNAVDWGDLDAYTAGDQGPTSR